MVDPIQRLILAFSRLPSIGEKSASRLTFFLLNQEPEITEELSQALSARLQMRTLGGHGHLQSRVCHIPTHEALHCLSGAPLTSPRRGQESGTQQAAFHLLFSVLSVGASGDVSIKMIGRAYRRRTARADQTSPPG